MEKPLADAVKAWESLTKDQQLEFVPRFEQHVRDILVYAGTLEPPVTPAENFEEVGTEH